MAEKSVIISTKVKYSGIGSFKDAYRFAHNWLKDEGYDIAEDNYEEKVKGEAKNIEVSWSCEKKLSDYFKSSLSLKWRIREISDVEVEIDGKKKQMNKFSGLTLTVKGTLVKDYGSGWSGSPVQKFMKDTYHKFVIPERTEEMEGKVFEDVEDFCSEIKAFFDLSCR